MTEHLTSQQWEDLLCGRLSGPEADAAFAHLETDCEICLERFGILVRPFSAPSSEEAGGAVDFDTAFDRAKAVVLVRHRSLERARARMRHKLPALRQAQDVNELSRCGANRLDAWAFCEALLECCHAERFGNPQRMVFFARWAQIRSGHLDPGRYGRWAVTDFQARAWAELANALRVADKLAEARDAMAKAEELSQRGSGDPLLAGRILGLSASLAGHERRFGEAVEKLNRAYNIFIGLKENHLAGWALIKRGLYSMYAQDLDSAHEALRSGLALIEVDQDHHLALTAHHNLIRLLMAKGEHMRARRELFRRRHLYLDSAERLDLLKLRWLEAQIDSGLGKLGRAEAGLKEVSAEFTKESLHYKAALVGLELAAVWVRQGKSDLVPPLADEIVAVFRSLGIAREAIATVLVLRQAYEQGNLTLQIVQHVARFLEDLERAPSARFEP